MKDKIIEVIEKMDHCYDEHEPIIFFSDECPVCKLREQIAEKDEEIKDLEDQVKDLEGQIE